MPKVKRIRKLKKDEHGIEEWILSRPRFHTGELLGLLHGFPGAAFRDSEVARREFSVIIRHLLADGKIVAVGMRWCETMYEKPGTNKKDKDRYGT